MNTWQKVFLSTLSLRRATFLSYKVLLAMPFLSTLSLRRATPVSRCYHKCIQNFYPRSPCGERRLPICKYGLPLIFLSTLSLRRATENQGFCVFVQLHFYPRSPCGERRHFGFLRPSRLGISIHALLAESDIKKPDVSVVEYKFLSTLSLRRATNRGPIVQLDISTFLSTLSLRRATVLYSVT